MSLLLLVMISLLANGNGATAAAMDHKNRTVTTTTTTTQQKDSFLSTRLRSSSKTLLHHNRTGSISQPPQQEEEEEEEEEAARRRTLATTIESKAVPPCACQPSSYIFTFDFSYSTCDETNIGHVFSDGDKMEVAAAALKAQQADEQDEQELVHKHGLDYVDCELHPIGEDDIAPHPWKHINKVEIYEVDQNQFLQDGLPDKDELVHPTILKGKPHYLNGHSFQYTSIITTMDPSTNCPPTLCSLPNSLHVRIVGQTTAYLEPQRELLVTFVFTKDCSYRPFLTAGQRVGPLVLVRVIIMETKSLAGCLLGYLQVVCWIQSWFAVVWTHLSYMCIFRFLLSFSFSLPLTCFADQRWTSLSILLYRGRNGRCFVVVVFFCDDSII